MRKLCRSYTKIRNYVSAGKRTWLKESSFLLNSLFHETWFTFILFSISKSPYVKSIYMYVDSMLKVYMPNYLKYASAPVYIRGSLYRIRQDPSSVQFGSRFWTTSSSSPGSGLVSPVSIVQSFLLLLFTPTKKNM